MLKSIDINLKENLEKQIIFRSKNAKQFRHLSKRTHFNYDEVEALAVIHRKYEEEFGPITRSVFRDIFHTDLDFTENIRHVLIDKVFSRFDKKNTQLIDFKNWVEGMSIILRGTIDERIHFAYTIYDFMRTNRLKKQHIFPLLRGCIIKLPEHENTEEAVKDLVDILLKKIDVDHDGTVSEQDFKKAVKKNNLLLECMGPVFPSRKARREYLAKFTKRLGRY